MQYFQIKNWAKFQHYKDRSPPWIKLHRDLLNDYNFTSLQDASKAHLMLLWLLASQLDNKIPHDIKWLKSRIGTTTAIDLKSLLDQGFIVMLQDASGVQANRTPETEAYREEKDIYLNGEILKPAAVSEEVWQDFLAHRKAKKSKVTNTAVEGIRREAHKAGWTLEAALQEICSRGWQGFKAEWVKKGTGNEKNRPPTKAERAKAALDSSYKEITGTDRPVNRNSGAMLQRSQNVWEGAGISSRHEQDVSNGPARLPAPED